MKPINHYSNRCTVVEGTAFNWMTRQKNPDLNIRYDIHDLIYLQLTEEWWVSEELPYWIVNSLITLPVRWYIMSTGTNLATLER